MKSLTKVTAVLLAVIMAVCMLPVAATRVEAASSTSAKIVRLGGADRIETANRIADEGWSSAETVFFANGFNYADALAGASLAYAFDAPILLTDGKSVSANVKAELNKLGAKNVYLLGGTAAIGAEVEKALKDSGINVDRVWGATRYETAVEIAKALAQKSGAKGEAFIASGVNYPDALAASPIAAIKGSPILYAPANGELDAATAAFLKNNSVNKAYILGGTSAVGAAVDGKLSSAGVSTKQRLGGSDRYDTALLIARTFDSVFTGKDVAFATGKNFPDALAGGVLAAKKGIPVLLTDNSSVNANIKSYVAAKDSAKAYVFGGANAVSDSIVKAYLPEKTPDVPDEPAVTYFTVTFDVNSYYVDNAPAPQVVAANDKAVKPADPISRTSSTFLGWYTDKNLSARFDFNTPITRDITLYAGWKTVTKTYTVTFDSNGGSSVPSQTVSKGKTAVKPTDPTRDGYTFDGWYLDKDGKDAAYGGLKRGSSRA